MPVSDLQRMMAEIDARADATHLVVRALIQRMAYAAPDPKAYVAELFANLSSFLDGLEENPSSGEYADARRQALRRNIDDLAAEMARDSSR